MACLPGGSKPIKMLLIGRRGGWRGRRDHVGSVLRAWCSLRRQPDKLRVRACDQRRAPKGGAAGDSPDVIKRLYASSKSARRSAQACGFCGTWPPAEPDTTSANATTTDLITTSA